MKTRAILIILVLLAIILLVPIAFRPKDAVAPVKEETSTKIEPQIEGNKEDLVFFSIEPGQEVSGKITATGSVGGYYFEGSFPIIILDENKNKTPYGPGFAKATSDWMASGPVPFTADFDFSVIPKGKYYIKLMQDDPSGGESGMKIRYILVPIIVK
jgi:hypothetical protein